jgi:hypothetical protein
MGHAFTHRYRGLSKRQPMYSTPDQPRHLVTIALHCHCLDFYTKITTLWPPSEQNKRLYALHFHQLISHVPRLSREFYMIDLTTESFEGMWRPIKSYTRLKSSSPHLYKFFRSSLVIPYLRGVSFVTPPLRLSRGWS